MAIVSCGDDGVKVCEGHAYDERFCGRIGCCKWDSGGGGCISNVGQNSCMEGELIRFIFLLGAFVRKYVLKYMHIFMYKCMCSCLHIFFCEDMHIPIHIYNHTFAYAQTHTRKYSHMYVGVKYLVACVTIDSLT